MMKYLMISIFILMLNGIMSSLNFIEAKEIDKIDQFQWKNRLLVIFSPSSEDKKFINQVNIIEQQKSGFVDRDLLVLKVVADKSVSIIDLGKFNIDGTELRKTFGVLDTQFRSFLVGKDGGVKLAKSTPINVCDLFDLIDKMPMRRQEVSSKGFSVKCN